MRGPGKLPPFTPLNPALSAGAFTIQRESPLDSGVTDGEARVRAVPPGKLNVKNGNPWRFHELQNMKVFVQFLEIRWC